MAIRVKHNVLVQISGDTAGKDKRYYPDTKETIIDGFLRSATKDIHVTAGNNDAMNLSDVDAPKGIYLEVDQTVDIVLNGNTISLEKASTATGTVAKFFMEGPITSLNIDNSGGANDVTGVLVLWGDT